MLFGDGGTAAVRRVATRRRVGRAEQRADVERAREWPHLGEDQRSKAGH
jgi:hypothetical protein